MNLLLVRENLYLVFARDYVVVKKGETKTGGEIISSTQFLTDYPKELRSCHCNIERQTSRLRKQ